MDVIEETIDATLDSNGQLQLTQQPQVPPGPVRVTIRAAAAGPQLNALRTGAELLAYWQDEGLVGTRPEITDTAAHARELREQAQRRARP